MKSDPWILDHAIDGKPVLPGVMGLELMAAVARHACPGQVYMGAMNVSFKAPVKVHRDEAVDLIVQADPVGPRSGSLYTQFGANGTDGSIVADGTFRSHDFTGHYRDHRAVDFSGKCR